MSKNEFLGKLRIEMQNAGLDNISNVIEYYDEMLEDRIEDGMTEEEAVASLESIPSIIASMKADKPMSEVVKERIKESKDKADKKGHSALWITLAIIGSPIWFSLLIALGALVFALYVTIWALVIAFFATTFALGIAAVACLVAAPVSIFLGWVPIATSVAMLGIALFLGGICIFLWSPVVAFAKLSINACKKGVAAIKRRITGKGNVE